MEQVSITITGKNWKDLNAKLTTLANELTAFEITRREPGVSTLVKRLAGDATSLTYVAPAADDESIHGEDGAGEYTLEDVKTALKKYASKGETFKDKAKKLLTKWKVKHVDDLPTESYSDIIESLK